MSYEILKERIETLPDEAVTRLEHYIEQLCVEYADRQKNSIHPSGGGHGSTDLANRSPTTEKIDAFLDAFPDAFNEFRGENKGALLRTMELTRNETW